MVLYSWHTYFDITTIIMSPNSFIAIFPKAPEFVDEVVIKGKIKDDASV